MAKSATVKTAKASAAPKAPALRRTHALGDHYKPGRYGRKDGAPGVTISLVHPVSIVTIIARAGKAKALSDAMKKSFGTALPAPGKSARGKAVSFFWCGAEQWFAIAQGMEEGALFAALAKSSGGLASLSDQSHARMMLRVEGPDARTLLARGTPVDLHPREFGPDASAMTQMAHVGVHVAASGTDGFELSVFRGFGESFFEWLTGQAAGLGYELR